jgi:hypothetical protein
MQGKELENMPAIKLNDINFMEAGRLFTNLRISALLQGAGLLLQVLAPIRSSWCCGLSASIPAGSI